MLRKNGDEQDDGNGVDEMGVVLPNDVSWPNENELSLLSSNDIEEDSEAGRMVFDMERCFVGWSSSASVSRSISGPDTLLRLLRT